MDADQHERLLTRDEVVKLIRDEIGLPLTKSRLNKDALTGVAPRPAAFYGRRQLYSRDDVLRYGRALLTAAPVRLKGSRQAQLDVDADRA